MKVITIGKRLVPDEHVAFIEPFDPASNPEFKPDEDYKGRVVLLNREMVLTEQTAQAFAAEHELHLFTEDGVAFIAAIRCWDGSVSHAAENALRACSSFVPSSQAAKPKFRWPSLSH